MTIQWFSPNTSLPTVTVASYGINFNNSCLGYLKGTKGVVLGCDISSKKMYVKLLHQDESNGFSIPNIKEEVKNVRISCKEFVQFLSIKIKIDITKPTKYFADFDEKEGQFIVDLSSPINTLQSSKKSQRRGRD
ncbi:hypothetical protein V7054_27130 [Priestia megaterium]|uniref:hypothetical protein n=1 Tax=Priestia megaterium TaxID=1404 RepID=UPI002FFE2240